MKKRLNRTQNIGFVPVVTVSSKAYYQEQKLLAYDERDMSDQLARYESECSPCVPVTLSN